MVEDYTFEFENMPVKLTATSKIPKIETSGITIEETEKGENLTVYFWVAWELVKTGSAKFSDAGIRGEEWTKTHYIERFQPIKQPSPLPDRFFSRAYLTFKLENRKAVGDSSRLSKLNRLKGMFRDIVESRIKKVVRLASAESAATTGALQLEEAALYNELYNLIFSWRSRIRKVEDAN